jgi:hypothetical protein
MSGVCPKEGEFVILTKLQASNYIINRETESK